MKLLLHPAPPRGINPNNDQTIRELNQKNLNVLETTKMFSPREKAYGNKFFSEQLRTELDQLRS